VSAPGPPAVAERVAVPAGTPAAAAAGLPLTGPEAIVVVRTPAGRLRDLAWVADADVEVDPVAMSSPSGLDVLRHSTAHVLAQAVQDLFPLPPRRPVRADRPGGRAVPPAPMPAVDRMPQRT
jgi:threonyl-tRNA synthetase